MRIEYPSYNFNRGKRTLEDVKLTPDNAEIQHGRRNLAINVTHAITSHIMHGSCWSCGKQNLSFQEQMKNNGLCGEHTNE